MQEIHSEPCIHPKCLQKIILVFQEKQKRKLVSGALEKKREKPKGHKKKSMQKHGKKKEELPNHIKLSWKEKHLNKGGKNRESLSSTDLRSGNPWKLGRVCS